MSGKDPTNPLESGLYPLVLKAVRSGKFDEAHEEDLIKAVRQEYLEKMKKTGHSLPESFHDGIDREIKDSLKAITYGFYSVKEYNQKRKGSF